VRAIINRASVALCIPETKEAGLLEGTFLKMLTLLDLAEVDEADAAVV
jgi:hypothetical protein